MAQSPSLIFSVLAILFVSAELVCGQDDANTCSRISECFRIIESKCDSKGQRQVCLAREDLTGCGLVGDVDTVCVANAFTSVGAGISMNTVANNVSAGSSLCIPGVAGGDHVSFGIEDGTPEPTGSGGPLDIHLVGRKVSCSAYGNFCSLGGSAGIRLQFKASSCPASATTSAPTSAPSTTTKKPSGGCSCGSDVNVGECSRTCGGGVQLVYNQCTGSGCSSSGRQYRHISCNPQACPGKWGDFSDAGPCSVTCGSGVATQSRTCISGNCTGSSTKSVPCHLAPCPRGGKRGGGRRRRNKCGRRLRTRCEKTDFKGRGCQKCVH